MATLCNMPVRCVTLPEGHQPASLALPCQLVLSVQAVLHCAWKWSPEHAGDRTAAHKLPLMSAEAAVHGALTWP